MIDNVLKSDILKNKVFWWLDYKLIKYSIK
jgi:hypothetical protein